MRGEEHDRLQSCSRWPEKGDCDQECLAQVDPSPENLERLLQKWYQGKTCAICERALTPADWRRSRLALLNEKQKLFELRHMHLDELPSALDQMAPLCWNCHQEERVRQATPPRILKGDRTQPPLCDGRIRRATSVRRTGRIAPLVDRGTCPRSPVFCPTIQHRAREYNSLRSKRGAR